MAFAVLENHKIIIKDEERLKQLEHIKQMNPDLEIVLSVGGAGAFGFSDMAMHEETRQIFYESLIDFIERYDLDGIDLDWEFPGADWGGDFSPKDKENYTTLLKGMRETLDNHTKKTNKPYLLTIAAGVGEWFVETTEVDKYIHYLDQVMLMTYDLRGFGQEYTGHHTTLYTKESDIFKMSAADGVDLLIENGVPKEKIVIGAAMYSRHWKEVPAHNNGLLQKVKPGGGDYYLEYPALQTEGVENSSYTRYWDDEAKVPWLYSQEKKIFITYDDQEAVGAKCDYINEKDLPGIMFWRYVDWPENPLIKQMAKDLK